MVFMGHYPGTPEGSTGSGSGFKASQKTGQRLKVSSDRLFFLFFSYVYSVRQSAHHLSVYEC